MFVPLSILILLSTLDKRKNCSLLFCLLHGLSTACAFRNLCFYLPYLDSSLSADVSCSQCWCGANLTDLGRYARSCSGHWTLHKKPHVWQPHIFLFFLLLHFKKCRNQSCTYIYWPSSAAFSWCWR